MRLLQTYPLLNFRETSSKDIFLRRLKGLPIDFGSVSTKDKSAFIDFAVNHNMLKFICHKEYRGILGRYDVLKEFAFYIAVNYGASEYQQWVSLNIGDQLEITELFPLGSSGSGRVRADGTKVHEVYRYVTAKERAKIYEM